MIVHDKEFDGTRNSILFEAGDRCLYVTKEDKMSEENKGEKPKWKGNGVAVWLNKGKDGKKDYLSIKLEGHSSVVAFEQD